MFSIHRVRRVKYEGRDEQAGRALSNLHTPHTMSGSSTGESTEWLFSVGQVIRMRVLERRDI